MGFHKMQTLRVDGVDVKPVPMPARRHGLKKKDAKAWRRTAPVHRAWSQAGLAAVAFAGCAAGYILLAEPSLNSDAKPAFATHTQD